MGIIIPLLPTTPFLLLAAACFIRSSDRLYLWLISHRWLGAYIRNYREYKAVTRRTKIVTLLILWGTLGFGAIWATSVLVIRILLLAVGVVVSAHVSRLKTMAPEMTPEDRKTGDESPDAEQKDNQKQ